MARNRQNNRPAGPRQHALELRFAAKARRLPPRHRPALTRRHLPPRTFCELDPVAGHWRQL